MILSSRRYLTLSVSTLAICVAAPAFAATTTTPGFAQSTTAGEVDSTLTISNIGDDFTFGVTDTGGTTATASVVSIPTGEVSQTGSAIGRGVHYRPCDPRHRQPRLTRGSGARLGD